MSNIEYLLNQCNQLKALLEKPEPGLSTWHLAVNEIIKRIAEFA